MSKDDPDEHLGDWSEQAKAMAEAAVALRSFYQALLEQGFTEGQALTLTGEWLRTMLGISTS